MGIDKIYQNFYKLFGGNDYFEENSYEYSYHKIGSDRLVLDGNFILYQVIYEMENDLNDLIKMILSIPHNSNRERIIECIFNKISKSPLSIYENTFKSIFEKENIEEMIDIIKNIVNNKNKNNIYNNLLGNYYLNYLNKKILVLHYPEYLREIIIVYDGIPSFSKVIEQKRRRIKNFLESLVRKIKISDTFENIPGVLSKIVIDGEEYNIDYGEYVKRRIGLSKSFGPSTKIFGILESILKDKMREVKWDIKFSINGVDEYGEGDYKILSILNESESDTCIHCSDFDFIFLGLSLQEKYNKKIILIRHFNSSYLVIYFNKLIMGIKSYLNNRYGSNLGNNIIDDICFIVNIFGNDHIPCLIELNFENDFLKVLDILYYNFWRRSKNIIEYNNINENNLRLFFEELRKISERCYLENYLKNNYYQGSQLCKILPKDIVNISMLRSDLLESYWLNKLPEYIESLGKNRMRYPDMRLILLQKILGKSIESIINGLDEEEKSKIRNYIINHPFRYEGIESKLDNILVIHNRDYGLRKKEYNTNLCDNIFENMYKREVYISQSIIEKEYYNLENKLYYKGDLNILEEEEYYNKQLLTKKQLLSSNPNKICNDYLRCLYYIYEKSKNPDKISLIHYRYYLAPKIDYIIENYPEKIDKIEWVERSEYFDSILHLIYISPHQDIEDNNLINKFILNNREYFIILERTDNLKLESIKNIEEILEYREIDIYELINRWKEYLIKLNYHNYKSYNLIDYEFETNLLSF